MEQSHRYYQNRHCRYFPCHAGADGENFNCLFCYCPLYCLGARCGGQFCYTEGGVKDCSNCLLPHLSENYEYINARLAQVFCPQREDGSDA